MEYNPVDLNEQELFVGYDSGWKLKLLEEKVLELKHNLRKREEQEHKLRERSVDVLMDYEKKLSKVRDENRALRKSLKSSAALINLITGSEPDLERLFNNNRFIAFDTFIRMLHNECKIQEDFNQWSDCNEFVLTELYDRHVSKPTIHDKFKKVVRGSR